MARPVITVSVECHSGYRGDETPRRFFLGKKRIEVAEVVDCWHGPDHRYFKLLGDDGCTYILRHDQGAGFWELTMFKRGDLEGD